MVFQPGTYYKFVALVRSKDFKDGKYQPVLNTNERGEIFVRQWFIDSWDTYNKYYTDMVGLCMATNARLYVTVDRKSVKKTILTMKDQLDGYIKQLVNNPDAPVSIRKLSKFSASASQMAECSDGPKYWLIDIDINDIEDEETKSKVAYQVSSAFKRLLYDKKVYEHMTANGFHLLVERTFDIQRVLNDFILNGVAIADEKTRKVLVDWNKCWSIKDNALTLVFMSLR
jgi:hypothetical protein